MAGEPRALPLRPSDPPSRDVYSLIFNGLTKALSGEHFMLLSERERVAGVIYDELRNAGVSVRFVGPPAPLVLFIEGSEDL